MYDKIIVLSSLHKCYLIDNAIVCNNTYGWTAYDDSLVVDKRDSGWQTCDTIAVSINKLAANTMQYYCFCVQDE